MATKVLVLSGGNSDEREVSLRSGLAVAAALRQTGYDVATADPAGGFQSLLPDMKAADVVFPALHGSGGEDGELQGFLEQHDISFVGSDSRSSALCFDKAAYAELLQKNDILTPQTKLVTYDGYGTLEMARQPHVLKPNDGGSSIGTIIVRDVNRANLSAIRQVFERYKQLLLQPLITGSEVTVAVVGEDSLPVIEIIPPGDQEFDYTNKYNGASQELCPPKHVSQADQSKARNLAKHIHQLCGCRDMSRTDIIISEDDKLYILETNTIPGLTDQSLLPKAAAAAGIEMTDLCSRLVRAALSRSQAASGN
jgi:D-alanine-D-alanine ligase